MFYIFLSGILSAVISAITVNHYWTKGYGTRNYTILPDNSSYCDVSYTAITTVYRIEVYDKYGNRIFTTQEYTYYKNALWELNEYERNNNADSH